MVSAKKRGRQDFGSYLSLQKKEEGSKGIGPKG
jgi:hypothetical protein